MNKQHTDEGVLDPTMKPVFATIGRGNGAESDNTLRYRYQLAELVTTGDQSSLLNRLEKGRLPTASSSSTPTSNC